MLYFLETLQVRAPSHGGVLYSFWYWWNVVWIFMNFLNIEKNKILRFFFFQNFMVFSCFMLFSTLKKIYIEKCPFTYWLNRRWFLQIVDGDSWNLYPLYPLFPCSDFVSQMWGGWGGGCNVFLTFYAISNISRKKILEYKPIISHLMFSSCFFCMLEILKSAPSLTATG